MAIDTEPARLFIACKQAGIKFGRLLLLGRQNYLLRPPETRALFSSFGLTPDPRLLAEQTGASPPFCEPFFECLGATSCDSMDVSTYEGATIIHDSNDPVPANLHEKFDMVFDGGTLEHVFHFPQALHDAMRMIAVGGWFVGLTPGNNWLGHGFYQFSPEVFYRAFSKQNGFSKCAVFAVPEGFGLKWYLVQDPARLRERTKLINSLRTPLLVLAQKTGATPPKLRPQQSDYQAYWDRNAPVLNTGKTKQDSGLVQKVKRALYQLLPDLTRGLATLEARPWSSEYSIRNPKVFIPVDKGALASLISKLPESC
jgi:hypothetical protein